MKDLQWEQCRVVGDEIREDVRIFLESFDVRTEASDEWLKAFGALDRLHNSLACLRGHLQAARADREAMLRSSVFMVDPPVCRRGLR